MPTFVCPQCDNDDSIQRVSAVVAGGTSTGSFSGPTGALTYSDGKVGTAGGYTTLSGSSSTNLAKLLALPKKPNADASQGGVILGIILVLIALALILGGASMRDGDCIIVSGIVILIIGISMIGSNINNIQEINSFKKPNWEIFKKKWEQLYYCHKHGIIIDPESGKTCEPAQIKEFVNEFIKDEIIKPQSSTGVSH
jgi:hypothetical protein